MGVKISKATVCSLCGMAGVLVTGLLAYKAGKKAQANPAPESETKKEKAVRVVKTYGPAVASGVATCGLIFAGDRIHVKKEIALGAAVAMWKEGYLDLEKATKEVIGEEKFSEIEKTLEPEKPEQKDIDESQDYVLSGRIKVYEPITDQVIWTTRECLAWVVLGANKKLNTEFSCPLNFVIKGLGGKPTSLGDDYIWDVDSESQTDSWDYYGTGPWIDIQIVPQRRYGETVLVLDYSTEPVLNRFEDKLYRESN